MCGINGIFTYNSAADFYPVVKKMNDALAHRGPDDKGVLVQNHVVLGHRRLSIIDLSDAAHQPMSAREGRYSIVFNGEIYNFKQLKEELEKPTATGPGESFTTNSDTEVLLKSYIRWGRACLGKLNGMFAFAIWDAEKRELFIARDRMGIKPLYFFKDDEKLVFSSELRAILETGLVNRKLSRKGLTDYLRYQTVHAPFTIVEGIYMLQPGHFLSINEEDFSIKQYWDAVEEAQKEFLPSDYSLISGKLKNHLFDAVEKQLVADVPFGAFLSGGIDSSALVAIMSEVSKGKVKTFNVSFEEKEFSEARYARMVAEKFQTDHTEINIKPEEFLKLLPEALGSLDHPSGDGPNTWLVSKVTREAGIKMALSGLGGDELFAGYDVFKQLSKLREKRWALSFPPFFRKLAGTVYKTVKPGIASDKTAAIMALDYFDISHVYPFSRQVLLDEQVYKLQDRHLLPPNAVRAIVEESVEYGTPGFGLPYLSRISIAEMYTYMHNVLLRDADQMGMSHGLEVRVPFLDHNLVRFVLAIDDKHKYPHSPKKLLVDALGGLLPPEIVNRPKMGFTFPWRQWLKKELRDFCMESIMNLGKRDGFNANELNRLWTKFLNNDPHVSWSRIWHLVVLENWLEENQID